MSEASERVRELARGRGLHLVGIAGARPLDEPRARYLRWLEAGRQGTMGWMTSQRAALSSDPSALLQGARSLVSVALAYWDGPRHPAGPNQGKIARYAWGRDYHQVMGEMLRHLVSDLELDFGGSHRWSVDTGPAMDKAYAESAALGWYGKNTNLLTTRYGSWILLGEILTTLALEPDQPVEAAAGCGSCRLCLLACPTGALGPEYTIDSRKCISYLTIEHRGAIPRELRPLMGDWVFGCDICQETCPPSMLPQLASAGARRRWAGETRSLLAGDPAAVISGTGTASTDVGALSGVDARQSVDLFWLLSLTHEEYVEAFRGTSIKRAKVWMLRRNAAVALGNVGGKDAMVPLAAALRGDEHAVVRGHAAWALGHLGARLRDTEVDAMLAAAQQSEADVGVLEEIRLSRQECDSPSPERSESRTSS